MGLLDALNPFRDTIVLKDNSSLDAKVKYLEGLKEKYPNNKKINSQLYMAQKGLAGEKEIMYQLSKANLGMYVLHDINIAYGDLKAQIDFVVITRWACYFIECKNLLGNITVNEKGDFIREYSYKGHKVKKGMESPYRQVQAQREVYKKIWAENRNKLLMLIQEKYFEEFHKILVVAANGENILNTKYAPKDMKYNIIKADALIRKLEYDRDHSDKETWSNQKQMESWANSFIEKSIPIENNFNIDNMEDIDEDDGDNNKTEVREDNNTYEVKESSSDKEELKNRLIEFRKQRATEKKIPPYYVFNNDELDKILDIMPKSLEELKNANILTSVKVNSHGKEIIEILNNK